MPQTTETASRCPFSSLVRQSSNESAAPRPGRPSTPIPVLLRMLDRCLDPVAGFLPRRTPVIRLPAPFDVISAACEELACRYHGDARDVRPWLDALFAEDAPRATDIEVLDVHTTESLMTQVSLLCHAYRWQSAPPRQSNYRVDSVALPPALAALWSALGRRLGIPRVGVFYTMVCNNWRLSGRGDGAHYTPDEVESDQFELGHAWLLGPERAELRAFIRAAIGIESRGAAAAKVVRQVYGGIAANDPAAVARALEALQSVLAEVVACFNRHIRKQEIRPASFLSLIQPTMVWLLDEGDGPLEGASGPQSCLVQLIDSVLGVPRSSALGPMLLAARRYMLPAHRCLLESFDGATGIVRDFVAGCGDPELRAAYDGCLDLLTRWRRSHRARGAMYIRGDESAPVEYASTGLVVGLDQDRVETFKTTMDGHIEATRGQRLDVAANDACPLAPAYVTTASSSCERSAA